MFVGSTAVTPFVPQPSWDERPINDPVVRKKREQRGTASNSYLIGTIVKETSPLIYADLPVVIVQT